MRKSSVIRQELQTEIAAQQTIVDSALDDKGVERALSAEETTSFDDHQETIKTLRAELARAEAFEENQRAAAEAAGVVLDNPNTDPEKREMRAMMADFSLHKAIRSQMPNQNLEGVELELHQEGIKRAKESGIEIQGVALPTLTEQSRAGQTVTQDGGVFGANLVDEQQQGVIEFLRPKPVVESMGARMLRGLTGNLKWPTNDGGISAGWGGEIDPITESKTAYGKKTMEPHRCGAAVVMSLQNIYQSTPDLERMTIDDMNRVMALLLDTAAINGSGAGDEPLGILNNPNVNTIAAGANGAAPTWDNIVALETAIYQANADVEKMGYLINAVTKGKLKTTKHQAGDLNYLMSMANTINGYKVGVSNLMPANLAKGTGTDLSAAIFGDFNQLLIGQFGVYDITVDNITKKKTGEIEVIINAFYDTLVRQDKSFAVIKDWLI